MLSQVLVRVDLSGATLDRPGSFIYVLSAHPLLKAGAGAGMTKQDIITLALKEELSHLAAFFLAFLTTLLAEMGDKTQLVTLTLSSRFPPRQVLTGALAALAAITALAAILGDFLAQLLPDKVALLTSGCFFLVTGILMLFWGQTPGTPAQERGGTVVVQTFLFVFFAELGDKTQLTAIALTAATGEPLSVFLGAMGGQFINHAAAAYLGSRFLTRLPAGTVRLASALLFVLFGFLFLFLAVSS